MTLTVRHGVSLAAATTLGVGGPARDFVRVTSESELVEALRLDRRVLVLGGGSNLVVADAGWDGLVVQLGMLGVEVTLRDDHAIVTAAAGEPWDVLVAQLVEAGLAGIESLAGIPGLVGATPIQNVGAYGQEIADVLTLVRVLDRQTGSFETIRRDDCGFGYRASRFKGSDRWIVVGVELCLSRSELSMPVRYAELARSLGIAEGERAPASDVRDRVIALRRAKGMVLDPDDPESRSAGSFFVNPIVDTALLAELQRRVGEGVEIPRFAGPAGKVKLSAGWLIERAGFAKGTDRGRVGSSRKHALALVNRGGATASELLAFAREIQDGVRERLGVELVPEPVIVGP